MTFRSGLFIQSWIHWGKLTLGSNKYTIWQKIQCWIYILIQNYKLNFHNKMDFTVCSVIHFYVRYFTAAAHNLIFGYRYSICRNKYAFILLRCNDDLYQIIGGSKGCTQIFIFVRHNDVEHNTVCTNWIIWQVDTKCSVIITIHINDLSFYM